MATIDRIRKRLAEQHDITLPADTVLVRSYAGWAMKAAGAWSWSLWSRDLPRGYGAQIPATDLLKCRHWTIDTSTLDQSIDPCLRCLREGYGTCKDPA